MPQTGSPLAVEMKNIQKEFSGVPVLHDVNLTVLSGEIHALVGENGAGKSTLMKILSGLYPRNFYSGAVRLFGQPAHFNTIHEAEMAGIVTVPQELHLVPELSVAENLYLGHPANVLGLVNWGKLHADSETVLERLGMKVDPNIPIRMLSTGRQQLVAIGRALVKKAKVLILDEPTAALPEAEVGLLFALLRSLKAGGVTCIYISHRLAEVFQLTDRITVLRDGQVMGTCETKDVNPQTIVSMMVGRSMDDIFPVRQPVAGQPSLVVDRLSVAHPVFSHRKLLENISFTANRGEIIGIAGLMGAGRSELLNTIYGALPLPRSGRIIADGKELTNHGPLDSIRAGIGLVTEERKKDGLVMGLSVRENMTLASLKTVSKMALLKFALERRVVAGFIKNFKIKTHGMEQYVNKLSGGNQQKVILAKWLATEPKILLLDEPTRGIDVGAKTEIYHLIVKLAAGGVTVLMASSELPELLGLCHRILVMREGRITGSLNHGEADEKRIMMLATGDAANASKIKER